MLAELGDITSRTKSRAAVGEMATDRKVGYRLTLRNVAGIAPRESYIVQIASQDVPADYHKLQNAVAQAKGNVRNANLNEQDKFNVTAQFDFDVPAPARETIDTLLAALGDLTGRTTSRAGPGETATDSKVGYRLTLRNVAGIAPRESYLVQLASQDVPADYHKLQDAVAQAKGHVRAANLSEQDKLNVTAQLDFDVPAAARETIDKLLAELGDITSRTTSRAAVGEMATDRKVGYRLTLRNVAGIPPRETFTLQAVSQNVPDGFRQLQDAVVGAKGHVRTAFLKEQDKLNITAQLDFDIPTTSGEAIDKVLAEIGEVYSRNTDRATPGDNATDRKVGYRLSIRNVAGLPPREKVSLGIDVKDVELTLAALKDMVSAKAGNVAAAHLKHEPNGQVTAMVLFDVPLPVLDELVRKVKGVGTVRVSQSRRNPQVPDTKLATAHLDVTLSSLVPIVPRDEGLWPQVRTSLSYSFKLLSWSLMFIILGLSVVLPWALVLWGAYRLVKRWRRAAPAGG